MENTNTINATLGLMSKRLELGKKIVERRERQIAKIEEINSQVEKLNKSMECVVIANIKRDYPDLVEDYKNGCMSYKKMLEIYQRLEGSQNFSYNNKESGC